MLNIYLVFLDIYYVDIFYLLSNGNQSPICTDCSWILNFGSRYIHANLCFIEIWEKLLWKWDSKFQIWVLSALILQRLLFNDNFMLS